MDEKASFQPAIFWSSVTSPLASLTTLRPAFTALTPRRNHLFHSVDVVVIVWDGFTPHMKWSWISFRAPFILFTTE